jgi:DNA-binding NtrC family response regulator
MKSAVVAYNGIDGACAAAMALLARPGSEVYVTSAARVARCLADMADREGPPDEILVCGVGVACDWEEVEAACAALRGSGGRVIWLCGRGYLEPDRERLAPLVDLAFADAGTNAAAVCGHFGLQSDPVAASLLSLARCDANIERGWREPEGEQAFWADLIAAAIADYFKYQDDATYAGVIGKLSRLATDEADRRRVDVYRRSGFTHVLWGKSQVMSALRRIIGRCADADAAVLIIGESGVGKEYVAHLIHERSERARGPMVPVNCGLFAGNSALANSTLFGHVKGAFTGAVSDREGAFVAELAELPLEVQAKLLRVIEDGWVMPEGADRPRKVDVRVLAATNRHLPDMIREGSFRADLYHRLDTLAIRVPPLREHLDDLEEIVARVLPDIVPGDVPPSVSQSDLSALEQYDWPGNVRQLIKVLRRSAYLGVPISRVVRDEADLGPLAPGASPSPTPLWPAGADDVLPIRDVRRTYAQRALDLHDGNLTATARALGVALNTLKSYLAGS